jgi:hypothetical protein
MGSFLREFPLFCPCNTINYKGVNLFQERLMIEEIKKQLRPVQQKKSRRLELQGTLSPHRR